MSSATVTRPSPLQSLGHSPYAGVNVASVTATTATFINDFSARCVRMPMPYRRGPGPVKRRIRHPDTLHEDFRLLILPTRRYHGPVGGCVAGQATEGNRVTVLG